MNIQINGTNYEVNTNLRLANKLQETFNKPYLKVIEGIVSSDARLEDQVKFIFIGYQLAGGVLNLEEFQNILFDNLGVNQIIGYLETMITELQYPGLNEAEIEEEIKKKLVKIKRMSSIENN